MRKLFAALMGTAALVAIHGSSSAETLTLGIKGETTSMSPLFFNWNPNNQIFTHVYSHLMTRGPKFEMLPGLAASWKAIDDKWWEFKLRKDVKWHDGSPFTVDDVLFTIEEAKKIKGTGSPGGRYFFGKEYKRIDDYTFHVTTGGPYPSMARDIAVCAIISKKHGTGMKTEDYNSGKAVMGTGPYKFVTWRPGDVLELEAWKDYWGGGPDDLITKPQWDKIVYKPIPSDPSRVAALLSGGVDIIDAVPTPDIARLRKDPDITISEIGSNRIIYFQFDHGRDLSPDVFTNDGKPMYPNPLRDWRVRKAISKAINRNAIVERVMEGSAVMAGQLSPPHMDGANPNLKPEPYDLEGAKKLLATAGYGDGFKLTIRAPNDRYVNDAKIVEAVAGMLRRLGLDATVQTEPKATYFPRNRGYSFMLVGFGSDTGDSASKLTSVLHTYIPSLNLGFANRGDYHNILVDRLVEKVMVEIDAAKRVKYMHEAMEIAMRDVANVPLHFQKNIWALRKGLSYPARSDERTIGLFVTKN